MKNKLLMGAVAMTAALLLLPAAAASAAGSFGHKPWHHGGGQPNPGSAVVSLEQSPYGPVLVVGGAGAGYYPSDPTASPPTPAGYNYPAGSSLYYLTSDATAYGRGSVRDPYQSPCTVAAGCTARPRRTPASGRH